jgi:chromosome segregation ATPase
MKNAKQMAMNAQTLEKQLQEKSRQIEQLHEARLAEQNERIAVAQTLAQRNHDLAEAREKLVRLEMESDGMGRMVRDVKRHQDENARLIKELEESKLEQGRTIARIETLKRKFNDEKNQNVSLTQKMQHLVGENASREDNLKREVLRLNNIIADQREKLLNAEKSKTVVNVQQPLSTAQNSAVESWNSEPVNGESSTTSSTGSSPSGAETSAQSISTNSSMVPVKRSKNSSAMTHITTIDAAMQEIGELEYEVDTLMEELEQEKVKHSETFNRLRETRAELREMKNLLSK